MGLSPEGYDFLVSFLFSSGLSFLIFLLFCLLRKRSPVLFSPRSMRLQDSQVEGEVLPNPYFFGWIPQTLSYSISWFEQHRGIDASTNLRFLKHATLFFLLCTAIALVTVVPANAMGHNGNRSENDPLRVEGLKLISMANIEAGSRLFWCHAVVCTIFTSLAIAMIYRDYSSYFRSKTLNGALPTSTHRTVMVKDLDPHEFGGVTYPMKIRSLFNFYNALFPGEVKTAYLVRDDPLLRKYYERMIKVKGELERAEVMQKNGKVMTHRMGLFGEEVESLPYYRQELQDLKELVKKQQKVESPKLCEIAFVTFNSVEAAEQCRKLMKDPSHPKYEYLAAPQPSAVHWKYLYIQEIHRWGRRFVVNLVVALLALFWAVPSTFVQTLGNLRELAKNDALAWLNDVLDLMGPTAEGFINSFLPSLLLFLLMAAVPPFITAVSIQEGRSSLVQTDQLIFQRYFIFLLINVFFVSIVAGSFFGVIFSILEGQVTILTLLGNSLPAQGSFFIQYVMVCFAFVIIYRLFHPYLLLYRWLRIRFAKSDSERAKLSRPTDMSLAVNLAGDLLIFQITLCYSVMYPFILIFGTAYFAISYLVSAYNTIFVHEEPYEREGAVWQTSYLYYFLALVIYQLTMIGALSLNKSYSWILVAISLGMTCIAWYSIKRKVERDSLNPATLGMDTLVKFSRRMSRVFRKKRGGLVDESSHSRLHDLDDQAASELEVEDYCQPEMWPVDLVSSI